MSVAGGKSTRSRLCMLGALVSVGLWLSPDGVWAAESTGHDSTRIASIGIRILAATVLAFLIHMAKQPLLLAYIAAGVLIGPQMGLGLVTSEADIRTISEIGLIILLFMIGLEIDISKLKEAGTSLLLSGIAQFLLCTAFGVGFFRWLGYGLAQGTYDALYLAFCCALSSTTIVVKLLYGKCELDTLAGRLTLGILVCQDIWAIVILGLQPNLARPDLVGICSGPGSIRTGWEAGAYPVGAGAVLVHQHPHYGMGYLDVRAGTDAHMLCTIVAARLALGMWGVLILRIARLQAARLRTIYYRRSYHGEVGPRYVGVARTLVPAWPRHPCRECGS
jgi:hypothetical protein